MGIIGRNGAGKSSIIEAIAWAIYGNQAARTGKDQIKSSFARQSDECRVSLKFEIRGEPYHVIRKISGKSDRAEVELFRSGQPESVGVSDTKDHVGELLGLDWRGFRTSFLAQQQELNALADLQPSRRKDHLAMMLGVDRIDRAIARSKEDARDMGRQTDFLERQLAQKEGIEKALSDTQREFVERQQELDPLETKFKEIGESKKVQSESLSRLQQVKGQYDIARVELESLQRNLAALAEDTNGLKLKLKELLDLKKSLGLFQTQLAELAMAKSRPEFQMKKMMTTRIGLP